MSERESASVLLPTTEWTPACGQVAAQLQEGDELLIICDTKNDPVATHNPPDKVEILIAGEPEGCSGKANAIAYGLERATNDRLVWTDADYERDQQWLNRLVAAGEKYGPATAIPFWYGNGFWSLIEPWLMMFSTFLMYYRLGSTGNIAWGGGLTFTEDELDITIEELSVELRRVLSDDALVSQHIEKFHTVESMVTPVKVPGDLKSTYHRTVRLARLAHVHEGMVSDFIIALLLTAAMIVFPLIIIPAMILLIGVAYWSFELKRPTFLFSPLGIILISLLIFAGISLREFEWAGRRYRLNGKYDVEVIS